MKIKSIIAWLFLLVAITGAFFLIRGKQEANATTKVYLCHCPDGNPGNCHTLRVGFPSVISHLRNHEYDYQGQCREVEPTPTDEPEPTPTNEPEPTPTEEPEVTPTPTNVPRQADPWDCSVDRSCHYEATPPQCTDGTTINVPANFHVIRDGDIAELRWIPTEGNQVNVFYKENGQPDWTHGLGDQDNDGSVFINALNPNVGYTFAIQQKNNCGGGEIIQSIVVDPPANGVLFRFSYWIKK